MARRGTLREGGVVQDSHSDGGEAEETDGRVLLIDFAPVTIIRIIRVVSTREPPDVALGTAERISAVPLGVGEPVGGGRRNIAKVATAVLLHREVGANEVSTLLRHQEGAGMVVEAIEGLGIREGGVLDNRVVEQRNAPVVVVGTSSVDCVVVVDSSSVAEFRALQETDETRAFGKNA